MRERVQAFGGSFEISGAPGEGVTVRAVLPLAAPSGRCRRKLERAAASQGVRRPARIAMRASSAELDAPSFCLML